MEKSLSKHRSIEFKKQDNKIIKAKIRFNMIIKNNLVIYHTVKGKQIINGNIYIEIDELENST